MRKSIYLIEMNIYLALGFVIGIIAAVASLVGGEPWDESLLLLVIPPGASVVWYVSYLFTINKLSSYEKGGSPRITMLIAILVFTAGGWLAIFVPGEIVRRIALRFYEGEQPVETVFGIIRPGQDVSTESNVKIEGDGSSEEEAKSKERLGEKLC